MCSATNADQKSAGTERITVMIKCNICARSIPDDSEFCPFCGSKVIHKIDEPILQADSLSNLQPDVLLKRSFLFIEEGNYDMANNYIEALLNKEPENAEAYLAKLLIDVNVSSMDDLSNLSEPFDDNINYKRALRYGNEKLKEKLLKAKGDCLATIAKLKEEELIRYEKENEEMYQEAKRLIKISEELHPNSTNESLNDAIELLTEIPDYKDSSALLAECNNALNYNIACEKITIGELWSAIKRFEAIIDYKDSKEMIKKCKCEIENDKKKRNKRDKIIVLSVAAIYIIFQVCLYIFVNI